MTRSRSKKVSRVSKDFIVNDTSNPCRQRQGFLIRGTYKDIHSIKVFVEHLNKINNLHHIGANKTPWGVSNFKNLGLSGHRPPFSFVKKTSIFGKVNKLFIENHKFRLIFQKIQILR